MNKNHELLQTKWDYCYTVRRPRFQKSTCYLFVTFFVILNLFIDLRKKCNNFNSLQKKVLKKIDNDHAINKKTKKQQKRESLIINQTIENPYHIFRFWNKSFPCYHQAQRASINKTNREGILYVKLHKAASSTLAGVAMQIGANHKHPDMHNHQRCHVQAKHKSAIELGVSNRIRDKSYLWTFVRDPKERALSSYFYFQATRQQENPTGSKILKNLQQVNNYQTNYIRTKESFNYSSTENIDKLSLSLLKEYDFVGLVEYLDESLVVLRLLLGLDPKDIIYLPAKQMGSYMVLNPNECARIYPKYTTPKVEKYLASDAWKEKNKMDYALVEAAKRSLQATIQSIGQRRFLEAFHLHERLLAEARKKCMQNGTYPCSEEGERQNDTCYWNDIGCGHDCIAKNL